MLNGDAFQMTTSDVDLDTIAVATANFPDITDERVFDSDIAARDVESVFTSFYLNPLRHEMAVGDAVSPVADAVNRGILNGQVPRVDVHHRETLCGDGRVSDNHVCGSDGKTPSDCLTVNHCSGLGNGV